MGFFGAVKKAAGLNAFTGITGSLLGGGGDEGFGGASNIHNYYNDPMRADLSDLQKQYKEFGNQAETSTYNPADYKAYQEKDFSGALPEYESVRNQTAQRLNQQGSQAQDAIQRRFARMGNLNSGAYAKQASLQDQRNAQAQSDASTNIGFQEAQQRRGLQQQESQKSFQTDEANNARRFGAGESAAQRSLARKQAGLQGQQGVLGMDLGFKSAQQEQAYNAFNAQMDQYKQKHSGGLLGSGGFLGTGLGGGMGGFSGFGI